jgi:hypothetical protein
MRLSLGFEGSLGVRSAIAALVLGGATLPPLTGHAQTAAPTAATQQGPAPVATSAPIDVPALAAQPAAASPGASGATPAPAVSSSAAPAPVAIAPVAPIVAPSPAPVAPVQPAAGYPNAQPNTVQPSAYAYARGQGEAALDGRYSAYPPGSPYLPRYHKERLRYRGIYVQPRIIGLFGVNFPHQFAEECPGLSCDIDSPKGFGGGALVGWGWKNTGIHLLVMGMIDTFGVDVNLPPAPEAAGGASGEAGGGFSFDIDDDGVSIDGSLFGDGSSSGSASDDDEPGAANATRTGVAFGVGIAQAWLRRPFRFNTGLSAGAVKRSVKGSSGLRDTQAEYTAPFIMGDVGFAFGRRKTFMIGAMAFVEFAPKVRLERNGVFLNVPVVTQGPQVFVGPYIAVQWGPKGRQVQPHEQYDEEVEYEY